MKHPSPTTFLTFSPRLANYLIVLLIGLHLALLSAGAFCTSKSLDTTPTQHSHPAASISILCSWACHVAQITSEASPTAQWSALLLTFMFRPLKPLPHLAQILPLSSFSPRGPPAFVWFMDRQRV